MRDAHANLELEILNHYPSGFVRPSAQTIDFLGSRRPFRTVGLPTWQMQIIRGHPSLYLSDQDMGISDYCHLGLGFEVGAEWADVIEKMSEWGTWLVHTLRALQAQIDASIAVVRVRQIEGRLRVVTNDNLWPPYQEYWRSFLRWTEEQPPPIYS